jgi:hypothetical protein
MLNLAVSLQFYCSQRSILLKITLTQQSVFVDIIQKTVETNNTENENSLQSSVSN